MAKITISNLETINSSALINLPSDDLKLIQGGYDDSNIPRRFRPIVPGQLIFPHGGKFADF